MENREDLGGSRSGVTEPAKDVAQQAKDQVKDLASQAKDQTVEMAHQAQDQVSALVDRQKEQTAERLGGLAGALHDAARQLEQKDADGFGRYAHKAADQMDRAARYLRDKDLSSLLHDTESLARRHPDLFLGGSLMAGVLLARFLKSSAEHRASGQGESKVGSRGPGSMNPHDRGQGYHPAALGGR